MKVFIAAVTVAAFTASPVFASAKLLNSAPRGVGVEH
jgi:hypothetical protein